MELILYLEYCFGEQSENKNMQQELKVLVLVVLLCSSLTFEGLSLVHFIQCRNKCLRCLLTE